jgi:hypothetical protein
MAAAPAAAAVAIAGGAHPGAVAKASPNYLARAGAAAAAAITASDGEVLQRQYNFVRWLSQTLMDSLYPGAWLSASQFAKQQWHNIIDSTAAQMCIST